VNGGDLGFVARGQSPYGKTLEEQAAKLKPGQISEVFKDRSGFHVLKAEEERPTRLQPLDEVRKQIALDLVKSQKAKELAKQKAEAALAQLRAGKELKDLYPLKKTEPGQFDFSAFTSPQTNETETFHPTGGYVPGIGQAPNLSGAVFAQTKAGAIPQAPVEEGDSWYVFRVKSRERADVSKPDPNELKSLRERLIGRKQGELYAQWVEGLRKKAKIVENEQVLSYEVGPGHEAFSPDDF
jgi:peptidyl-prolyl cis-trans isomerase D